MAGDLSAFAVVTRVKRGSAITISATGFFLFVGLVYSDAKAAQIQTHLLVMTRSHVGNGALVDYTLSNGRRRVISELPGTAWSVAVKGDRVYVQTADTVGDVGTGAITEYDVASGFVSGRIAIGATPAYWMAIDSRGSLYVPTELSGGAPVIQQYAPGGLTLKGTIRDGIVEPRTIVIDRFDSLYVANAGTKSSITIYPYGAFKPSLTIDRGIGVPQDIAIGKEDQLYVAATQGWSVKEYAPNTGQVLRAISETGEPQRLAVSPSGLLAVECDDNNGSNFIDLYTDHLARRLSRIVPRAGARFGAMVFDNRDTLYTGEEIPAKSARTYTEIAQYTALGQRQRVLGDEAGIVNFALYEPGAPNVFCPSRGRAWAC